MDFILAISDEAVRKLALGGSTLLIGLVMVFIVLGILIGLVSLVHVILDKVANRKSKKTEAVPQIVAPNQPQLVAATNNNEEIVAAITAAISMYYDTQYASTAKSVKFRVRSIKEIR